MPSWKKVIVSGSAARISTLFTSGHLTASGNFSGSFQSTGSIGRMELDSLQVTKVIEATASHAIQAITSSLAQKVDFTRFGNTVTDDYHVMLGGDAGATGGSGLRIQTGLKATSENSQNHLKYNVSTGRMEGVQNLIGTSSIATNINYIAHSKTSSFVSPNFGGVFYDVPLIRQQGPLNERDGGGSIVGHQEDARPTLGVGENRIRYNPVTMHLSGSVSSSASFANIIAVGSSSFGNLTIDGALNSSTINLGEDAVITFEGANSNNFETTLTVEDPDSDNTITLPNSTGTIALTSQLHDAMTLDNSSYNYITKNGQELTVGQVLIEEDTNLTAGGGITLTGNALSLNATAVTGSWSSQYFNTISAVGISGSLGDNAATIRTLTKTGISGSLGPNAAEIRTFSKAGISGSLGPNAAEIRTFSKAGISGSLGPTADFVRSLTSTGISGSLGPTADFIRSLNATGISGSNYTTSHSLQGRVETTEAFLNQSVKTDSSPTFAGLRVQGDLLAERYIVSSSVTHLTSSFSSGSTIFGDSIDDTHKFTGSFSITGSIISTGSIDVSGSVSAKSFDGIFVGALSSSAQIKDAISGSFNETSASISTIRNTQSQSVASRLANVEAGNIGDGSSSGDNTGDVTLNTGTADYLSISNQQITLNQIDLSTDVTGNLDASHLNNSSAKTFISGAFNGASSSLSTRTTDLETDSGSFATRTTDLKTDSGSFSTRTTQLEAIPTFSSTGISGSLGVNADTIRSLTKVGISGSLGVNADTIRSLTKTGISGSFTPISSSITDRLDTLESDPGGIFSPTGSFQSTINDVVITGSLQISSSQSSTAIKASNIQNGYPTSNNWKESLDGSFFNNFDNTTHVSEILRFMAGVLSHSLDVSDARPNTKILSQVNTTFSGTGTTTKNTLFNGILGSSYASSKLSNNFINSNYINPSLYNANDVIIKYLIHKGFVTSGERGSGGNDVGTNPFNDGYGTNIPNTISTNAQFDNFTFSVQSVSGGSSQVSSSVDSQLFGLGGLSSGNANEYKVRIIASQSFSDSNSVTTPTAASNTFHTKSMIEFSQNSFGTSNGLTLAKINTTQPAVIPAAFQDGKFASVSGPITGRFEHGGLQRENELSSSGYYRFHDIKVGLQTGSGNFNFKTIGGSDGDSKKQFYLYTGGINTDITTNVPAPQYVSSPDLTLTTFTATSRSLSGAPYLLTTTYSHKFSSRAFNLFEPAYSSLNCLQHSLTSDGLNTVGSTSLTNTAVNIDANGVNTDTDSVMGVIANGDFDYANNNRSDGTIPTNTDNAYISSSFSFSLDSSFNNVVQTRTAQSSLNYTTNFLTTARNWKNTSSTDSNRQLTFYDNTLFGQPSASGSMAIYSFAQGYDSNNLQDTTETFTGEDHRIQLNNDVLDFNGDAWDTTYNRTSLGRNDLQVKPGYLVEPSGDYGYWYPTNYTGAGTNISSYRYYIRRFQTNGSTFNSMTIDVGAALYKWRLDTSSPSDNVSVGLIFKSFASNGGSSSTYTRIFDPSDFTGNDLGDSVGGIYNNPFSDSINKRGNPNGSVSGTTYTVPLSNADGQTLDASNNEIYVIIRYRNDPTPITGITLTFS